MLTRLSLTLSLMIVMTSSAMSQTVIENDQPAAEETKATITPEEQREAQELIARFVRRYEETNDITPLLDEFFIEDFAARRAKYPKAWLPYAYICRETAQRASEGEWRRFYAAMINLWYWGGRLYKAGGFADRQSESEEESKVKPEDVFTPEMLRLLKEDYIFMEMFGNDDEKRKAKGYEECNTFGCACASEDEPANKSSAAQASGVAPAEKIEDYGISVKTIARMNHLSAMLEQVSLMAREKMEKLEKQRSRLSIRNYSESEDEESEKEPSVTIVDKEFLGYPAGTRFICHHALWLHICMIRGADGRLRIVSLGVSFEDD
ncbi:MAG TPA: hypothetical protein VF791_20350 [Pyrinomonadaceae bacterium]